MVTVRNALAWAQLPANGASNWWGGLPDRFQCAGCGLHWPDASYLPALEQHIADLRADRETARAIGAADYVQTDLTAEIDAFTRVTDTMR